VRIEAESAPEMGHEAVKHAPVDVHREPEQRSFGGPVRRALERLGRRAGISGRRGAPWRSFASRPTRAPRLRDIRLRALRDSSKAFGGTLAESEARPAEVWMRQLRELATFVAATPQGDVGMVRTVTSADDPATALLLSMWVAPSMRGRGVGEALVEAVVEWARRNGHERVELEVRDANAPAVALYERLGFVWAGPTSDPVPEHRRVRELTRPRGSAPPRPTDR